MHRKISDKLSVGSSDDARRMGGNFDRVVSLASPPESSTHQFLIDDGEHDYETFKNAVDCAIEGLDNGEDVLVHCNAGISRSVSACIAICVTELGMNYTEAFKTCRGGFMYPDENLLESAKKYINENSGKTIDTSFEYGDRSH